jgi:hypothetical protein
MDQIVVLLSFLNQEDNLELFINKETIEETISLKDFLDEITEILEIKNPNFKTTRILYIDNDFGTEVDVPIPPNNFLFENKQKFKILCVLKNSDELIVTNEAESNAAVMNCTMSIDAINMEDYDVTFEEKIKSIVNERYGEQPRYSTIWRKKIVRVIGSYMMLN